MIKRHFFPLLLLLLFCPGLQAQEPALTLNKGDIEAASYYQELPYELAGGKMVVTINIQDKPYRFIWDSGAPLLLSRRLYTALQPRVTGAIPVTDAFGKKDSMRIVELDGLRIGSCSFSTCAALVANEDSKGLDCLDADGLIGSNILRNAIVQLDPRRKLIILTNQESRLSLAPEYRIPLFKTPLQSNPFIKIGLPAKVSVELLFDSGADDLLNLSNAHYRYISTEKKKSLQLQDSGYGSNAFGIHGYEEQTTKYRLLAGKVTLGKHTLEQVPAETMDDKDSRIGLKLLRYGIVTLDYKNSGFYFQPFSDKKKTTVSEKDWLIKPTIEDDKLKVGMVWGKAAGLARNGEEIVAINGKPLTAADLCDLFLKKIWRDDQTEMMLDLKGADGVVRQVKNRRE